MKTFGQESHLITSILESLAVKPIAIFPNSKKCIFLGYGEYGDMGYRVWDPKSKKVIYSNDVYFNDAKFHEKPKKTKEIRQVAFQEDGPSTFGQQVTAQVELI